MTDSPAAPTTPPTLGSGWSIAACAVPFVLATGGATSAWVGRLSAPDPADADHLWQPWPPVEEHELLLGVVSTVMLVLAGAVLATQHRRGSLATATLGQVLVASAFAAWLGLGYQVVTDGVVGANIGGAGMVLLTPAVAAVSIALVAVLGHRRRHERARPA